MRPFTPTKLKPFEFQVWRDLQSVLSSLDRSPGDEGLLLACSGGVDSVAMLQCLAQLQKRLKVKIKVVNIHHGFSSDPQLTAYRAVAAAKVEALSSRLGLEYHSLRRDIRDPELKSESALRTYRRDALRELARDLQCSWIALAHHADDLLETRLIRLLRGTASQGLRAMKMVNSETKPRVMRPFLERSRVDIESYARACGLEWCEDPSNRQNTTIRNWLRNDLLPQVAAHKRGAVDNLARGLSRLAESTDLLQDSAQELALFGIHEAIQIRRSRLADLGKSQQRRYLGAIFLSLGVDGFSSSQIDEILKRLDSGKTRHQKFTLAGLNWLIDGERVMVAKI